MSVKCLIIEDEPLAQEKLEDFIKQVDFLELTMITNNGLDAISFLKSNTVDLIFLDIRMKKFSGLQFLQSLQTYPKIIITTAYNQYALDSYDYDVCDYLLKPFSFERFVKAVNKVTNEISTEVEAKRSTTNNKEFIFIKTEYRIERILLNEILYIEGLKDYLKIVLESTNILTLMSFNKIMEMLPDQDFFRVHNSYIVSLEKIKNIERNRININNKLIPISDTYKKPFYAHLTSRNLLK